MDIKNILTDLQDWILAATLKNKLILAGSVLVFFVFMIILCQKPKAPDEKSVLLIQQDLKALKRYHLYTERGVAPELSKDYIVEPEEINIESDNNYLKSSLSRSRLFTDDERKLQQKINELLE